MRERLLGSLGLLGIWVILLTIGTSAVIGGYWISDRAYGAGLWPIAAVMNIALLFLLAGVAISAVILPIGAIVAFFKKDWLEEP